MPHKSGYRAGIPQKEPYTKWDTEKDEIEVDYKQMDDSSPPSWFSGPKGQVLKVLLLITVFLVGIVIGYIIRRSVHEMILHPKKCDNQPDFEDYSHDISQSISSDISAQQIENFLKNYTKEVHFTGSLANKKLHSLLQNQMQSFGLAVDTPTYKVLISYTDWQHRSSVSLLDDNNTVMYETTYKGPKDQSTKYHPEMQQSFAAFSPNATVEGDIVFANYGTDDDFAELQKKNVSCKGSIIIMRYGEIYRGLKVQNAEKCGAKGVLMYSDPAAVTGTYNTRADVYPHTWFLPNWTSQSGSILPVMEGDPLTPDLPSKEGMYRIPQKAANLPKIPTLPISYGDAEQIMKNMAGLAGSSKFQGSLGHPNVTYRLGPGYDDHRKNWRLKLEVNMDTDEREITNVIGVIKGDVEPDRYVIVGCHYDSWGYGAVDPGSGTSLLMELARVFGNKHKQGWRSRRTLMFVHWDAEEQGLMGSYEWVQEHANELSERTVAYINLDGAIRGNHSLDVQGNPMLRDLIKQVAKQYTTPLGDGQTVLKQWQDNNHDMDNPSEPRMEHIGPGSDQAPFVFLLGVAAMWPRYTFDNKKYSFTTYPAYHSIIDNYNYIKKFIDPEFKSHRVLAQIVAELTLELSTRTKLPFNAQHLSTLLKKEYDNIHGLSYSQENLFTQLGYAVDNFSMAAGDFQDKMSQLDLANPLEVRRYNDRLLRVSQAFIYPAGLPGRPLQKNLLFGQSSQDKQLGLVLTGIHDAYSQWTMSKDSNQKDSFKNELHRQISLATVAVRAAARTLQDVDVF